MSNQIRLVMKAQLNTPPYQYVTWSVYNQPDNTGAQSGYFGQLINIAVDYIIDPSQTINPISLTVGGDLTGSLPNPSVSRLQGKPIAVTAPTSGQTLVWNGTSWTPTTIGSTPTGAAGGDLGGTYPSPTVIGLQGIPVANAGASTGNVLAFTGGAWTPGNTVGDLIANSLTTGTVTNTGNVLVHSDSTITLDADADIVLTSANACTINSTGPYTLYGGNGITLSNQAGALLLEDPSGGGITIDSSGGGDMKIIATSGFEIESNFISLTTFADSYLSISNNNALTGIGYNFTINGSGAPTGTGGNITLIPGTGATSNGNLALFSSPSTSGTDTGGDVVWIGNRTTVPGVNPDTTGFIFYSESGVAKIRSGANTVTLGNKPAVTGSKASGAALASLLTVLAAAGIITDNTTA